MKLVNMTSLNGVQLNTKNKYCDDDIRVQLDRTVIYNGEIQTGGNVVDDDLDKFINGTLTEIRSNVSSVAKYAFSNTQITHAYLPNATQLYEYSFQNSSLKYIDIPNVTHIEKYTFSGSVLTSVYFPSVTWTSTNVFQSCKKLIDVNLPALTGISGYLFQNCSVLETVNLPSASGGINYYAFYGCSSLINVNIPNVTYINSNAFDGCTKLSVLKFPLVDTIYGNAFRSCSSLADIYLGYNGVVALKYTYAFSDHISNTIIHVRSEYADQYTTATNWSTLIESGRITIVGDYID